MFAKELLWFLGILVLFLTVLPSVLMRLVERGPKWERRLERLSDWLDSRDDKRMKRIISLVTLIIVAILWFTSHSM
ncbi:hypothetical protein [Falsibacillus pallidus]|uniref:Uncharacterized protein n=1 Tax=Falsibacillus pallidus TaxID=493781 RepID=A0A370GPZ0_9BACI|nr:hypothetical protein [Falsibacillus pallidus]RDI45591.1 hypothetical protein DFR59_102219 [Falsibacillus pallidus]